MPFGPTLRRDLECTAASVATEVVSGVGVVGGVSAAAVSSQSTGPTGIAGRSCGSSQHPSHTTVQRMSDNGGSREGAAAAPRGHKGSASTTTTVANAPGGVFKDAPRESPPPPPPANRSPCVHAPFSRRASEEKASAVKFPTLTRAIPASASSLLHGIGASAIAGASSPGSSVMLPPVQPPRSSNTVSEFTSTGGRPANRPGGKWANPGRPSGTSSSPLSTRATLAPLLSPSTTAFDQHPTSSADVVKVSVTSGSPQEDTSSVDSGSSSHVQRQLYFRENNIPSLFNELSEALLEAQPADPVSFIKEWLQKRREAIAS
ncbi:hypothetical protein JKF63_01041 [Porcisia hertigi]|uniref:Uncharacterized protein n=1 Tax=Porcisia hertigi TaxID=2761500 RepID=A0A836IDN2_9TRYP|nr:hypothetical protein JKF63_01041 [Porcisia hertigi]